MLRKSTLFFARPQNATAPLNADTTRIETRLNTIEQAINDFKKHHPSVAADPFLQGFEHFKGDVERYISLQNNSDKTKQEQIISGLTRAVSEFRVCLHAHAGPKTDGNIIAACCNILAQLTELLETTSSELAGQVFNDDTLPTSIFLQAIQANIIGFENQYLTQGPLFGNLERFKSVVERHIALQNSLAKAQEANKVRRIQHLITEEFSLLREMARILYHLLAQAYPQPQANIDLEAFHAKVLTISAQLKEINPGPIPEEEYASDATLVEGDSDNLPRPEFSDSSDGACDDHGFAQGVRRVIRSVTR